MTALADRVSMVVDRADFDDLVTLVTQAPTWEKDRLPGIRMLLRAIGEGKADAPEQILGRWTWRLARASRKAQDRRASAEFPEAKRLLGALANSRGHRHEENAARLVNQARELPIEVGAALLASAEGYTPRATQLIDAAREQLGSLQDVAFALAENLPAPKQGPSKSRRRRRRKRKGAPAQPSGAQAATNGAEAARPPDGRRGRSRSSRAAQRRRERRSEASRACAEAAPAAARADAEGRRERRCRRRGCRGGSRRRSGRGLVSPRLTRGGLR